MPSVQGQEVFNSDEVTIFNDNGESMVVSRTSLIKKSGLLKYSVAVCSNERKFIVKLPLTLKMLQQFARFLEKKVVKFTSADNGFKMYLFAKRYFISRLEKMCLDYFKRSISTGNVCRIHDLACGRDVKQLQYECYSQFSFSDKNIFRTDDFKSCQYTTIYKLLTCPIYSELKEFDLYMGLRTWMEKTYLKLKKTNTIISRRDIIKPFLPLIRFFAIKPEFLKHIVENCEKAEILTEEEVRSIREFLTGKNVAHLPVTISANVQSRESYRLFTATNFVRKETIKWTNGDFQFMADMWVPKICTVNAIELPITHFNSKGIKVLFGAKSTYSHDFLYERGLCDKEGIVRLKNVKLLLARSFHIFTVKVPREEIRSNIILFLEHAYGYVPIYDFPYSAMRSEEEGTIFQCRLYFVF
ncbi:uncharacterized protein LOC111614805 isoform X1 [Centruroides sculpturatus]|uniref:uncharacterized protein LOC111614805 isoform X1 n=1 Tax=Centruroides sculpturatus TaxID=218467 RepID=UPI000C6DD968|nr:uncharacterized protein LOC111614805 isoform X1 [Centruroides sculpturatus]